MTYFSFFPQSLKLRKLKVAIVFVHDKLDLKVWLAGYNKMFRQNTGTLFKESHWNNTAFINDHLRRDSILEYTLVENPDFSEFRYVNKANREWDAEVYSGC